MKANPVGHGCTENDIGSTIKQEETLAPWNVTPEKMVQNITVALGEIFKEAKTIDKSICIDFPSGYLVISPLEYRVHMLRTDPEKPQWCVPIQESVSIFYKTNREIHGGREPFVQYVYENPNNWYGAGAKNGTDTYNFNSPNEWQCRFFNAQTERAFVNMPVTKELLEKIQRFFNDITQILTKYQKPVSIMNNTKARYANI